MALPDVPDVYRITVFQTSQGEEVINVFHYRDTSIGGPTAVSVAQGFWDKVKAGWRAIPTTTQAYTFDTVRAEALFSPYVFADYSIPLAEQAPTRVVASEPLSTVAAGMIRLTVGTRATRPGSKRISGLVEVDAVGNNLVTTIITALQTLGGLFDDTFNASGTALSMTPVIVGYPGPQNPGAPRVQDVIGSSVDGRISHQVSRDPRRN